LSSRPPPPRSAQSPSPASRGRIDEPPRPRLYLFTPRLADPAAFVAALPAALAAADAAAILLRQQDADERTLINRAKAIAAIVQKRDVALILDGHPEIAVRAGADGAHLTGLAALEAALAMLKPDRIAGAGGLHSRHDAMLAGEARADYVMFGEPDRRGGRPPFDALKERIAWWAELFESPCIGYAASLGEVGPLAQAGADFVALGDWIWTNALSPAETLAAAGQSLIQG
jgi:thiamine-phosphate pyrophosphorylase